MLWRGRSLIRGRAYQCLNIDKCGCLRLFLCHAPHILKLSRLWNKELTFYPDFDHPASQLSAFSLCIDVFIISLKNGEIVKFKPDDVAHFKKWLYRFRVRDIELDDGLSNNKTTANLAVSNLKIFNPFKRNNRNEK